MELATQEPKAADSLLQRTFSPTLSKHPFLVRWRPMVGLCWGGDMPRFSGVLGAEKSVDSLTALLPKEGIFSP